MSLTLGWQPVVKDERSFKSFYNSDVANKLSRCFGAEVNEQHISKLIAFYEATGDEIWKEIADIITEVGPIKIVEHW